MIATATRLCSLCVLLGLLGCGGVPPTPGPTAPAASSASKQADGPFRPQSADDLRAALVAASVDVPPLLRLIDPEWGVGTFDTGDTGIAHHCDRGEFTNHPGMAFTVHEDDRFTCDRSLRRCSSTPRDGGGFAFYFRQGAGGATYLDTIVHYDGRSVPGTDSRAVQSFAAAGDGVCAFRRALRPDASPSRRLSVFVAHHTGLVEDTVSVHLCGDEAAAAYQERVAPQLGRVDAFVCTRAPTRCSLRTGDEDVAIFGDGGGVTGVTITRHGMFPNLERAQERDRAAFARGMASHACAD